MNANRRTLLAARTALAVAVTLALSGCLKLDVELSLDGDQVDGSMIVGVSREALELTGSSVEDFLAAIDAGDDIPDGATVSPYEDDEYVGQEYLLDGVDIAEFDNDVVSITYDEEAGTYEVTGDLDLTELGPQAAELGEFDMSVSITFPGEVTEHNGELDGRTVTWTPVFGEANEIFATAGDGRGGGLPTGLLVAIAVAGVAALAGLVAFLARRNRSGGGDTSELVAEQDDLAALGETSGDVADDDRPADS
jgi:hypothetical protein